VAKILIVDDSNMARRILRRILVSDGHEVIEADNGIAAIERYFLDKPDLVLLDLTMGGMYGLDVLNKLREMDVGARVIVATADIQRSTRAMLEAAGARGYVPKPFEETAVLDAVNAVLIGGG